MKQLVLILLLFVSQQVICQKTKEKKIDEFLISSGIFQVRKDLLHQHLLKPLEVTEGIDNTRIVSIKEKLTDSKILETLRKPYLEIFSEQEINEISKFYSSNAAKKLIKNYAEIDEKINTNFDWVYDEINRIVASQNLPKAIKSTVFTDNPNGFYEVTNNERTEIKDMILSSKPTMDFSMVSSAELGKDQLSRLTIEIKFNEEGASKFRILTEKNIGKPIAVVINRRIVMAPIVNEAIPSGKLQISGNFSEEEANDFVNSFERYNQ